jgi:hypothetical protein
MGNRGARTCKRGAAEKQPSMLYAVFRQPLSCMELTCMCCKHTYYAACSAAYSFVSQGTGSRAMKQHASVLVLVQQHHPWLSLTTYWGLAGCRACVLWDDHSDDGVVINPAAPGR